MSSARQSRGASLGAETDLPKPYSKDSQEKMPDKRTCATEKSEPKRVGFGKAKGSRKPSNAILPLDYRRDLSKMAREHQKKYGTSFKVDATLKDRAARFYRSQLPPLRRAGRPGISGVTIAIRLKRVTKQQDPDETAVHRWGRIYPIAIPNHETLTKEQQRVERILLRERVKSRKNQQRRRRTQESADLLSGHRKT